MSYSIVGAIYDAEGNPITPDELEQIIAGRLFIPRSMPGGGGAAGPVRMTPSLAAAVARRAPVALNRPTLQETRPTRVDEVPLPINSSGNVAAGTSVPIATTSQIIFQPRRLVVPPSLAPFFTVESITVGNVPLFAGSGSIPAEVFNPDSDGVNMRKTTANPGVQIIVNVTNIDGADHPFRAAIFGPGAQPDGCS